MDGLDDADDLLDGVVDGRVDAEGPPVDGRLPAPPVDGRVEAEGRLDDEPLLVLP